MPETTANSCLRIKKFTINQKHSNSNLLISNQQIGSKIKSKEKSILNQKPLNKNKK